MTILKRMVIVLISALIYFLFFYFNKLLFDSLEYSYGTNWIFIPSGIQFVLVLIAIGEGALGIFLASFFIGLENYYLKSVLDSFITALITAISPLLARKISFDFLSIEKELLEINASAIVKMSLVFSLLSASLHQLWFFFNGKSAIFIQSLLVMFVGNLLGTALVLVLIKVTTYKFLKNNSSLD